MRVSLISNKNLSMRFLFLDYFQCEACSVNNRLLCVWLFIYWMHVWVRVCMFVKQRYILQTVYWMNMFFYYFDFGIWYSIVFYLCYCCFLFCYCCCCLDFRLPWINTSIIVYLCGSARDKNPLYYVTVSYRINSKLPCRSLSIYLACICIRRRFVCVQNIVSTILNFFSFCCCC